MRRPAPVKKANKSVYLPVDMWETVDSMGGNRSEAIEKLVEESVLARQREGQLIDYKKLRDIVASEIKSETEKSENRIGKILSRTLLEMVSVYSTIVKTFYRKKEAGGMLPVEEYLKVRDDIQQLSRKYIVNNLADKDELILDLVEKLTNKKERTFKELIQAATLAEKKKDAEEGEE